MISLGIAILTSITAVLALESGLVALTQVSVGAALLAKARRAEEENNETFTLWQLNGRDGFLMDSELTIKTMLEATHSDKAAQIFVKKLWDLGEDADAMKRRRAFVRKFRTSHNKQVR